MEKIERERKWRLKKAPPVPEMKHRRRVERILQGYLVAKPEGEARLRARGGNYILTFKGDGDLEREEYEVELNKFGFDLLWSTIEGNPIDKTRWSVPYDRWELEIDFYDRNGPLAGLIIMEVEFTMDEDPSGFQVPPWAEGAIEVTNDPRYKHKNLALHGLPK